MMRMERAILHLSNVLKLNFCKGFKIMRKYFLLSAVALLATSNANAEFSDGQYYGIITANASIVNATKVTCTDLDFGRIVLDNQRTTDTTIEISPTNGKITSSDSVISVTNYKMGNCNPISVEGMGGEIVIDLKNEHGDTINAEITGFEKNIGGILTIPSDAKDGDYSGSYTVIYFYEQG